MTKLYELHAHISKMWGGIESIAKYYADGDVQGQKESMDFLREAKAAFEKSYGKIDWTLFDLNGLRICNTCIVKAEELIASADAEGRKFILRRIFHRFKNMYTRLSDNQTPFLLLCFDAEIDDTEITRTFCDWILDAMRHLCSDICKLTLDAGIKISDVANYSISENIYNISFDGDVPTNYMAMPRNQRVAIIHRLLREFGIKEGAIDLTAIAKFAEVVTGGNMNIKGQNTYAYKHLTDKLSADSQVLLKNIGLTCTT